ncbi:MAG TPA: VWA domain-containing protein [Terriglobales bacterium]|nr:VWA domain-containing protein [Terriglobales bacterium]
MSRRPCSPLPLLLLLPFLTTLGLSQSSDDVHITPAIRKEKPNAADGVGMHLSSLRVDVNLVTVPVVVTDLHGSPVLDLRKKDFQLVENQTEQHIDYFYSEDAPLSVGLILDLSSSMGDKLDRVREAVDEFFNNADPRDDYFVITFADKAKVFADTTQSTATIQARLAQMKAKGNTALADAIHLGLDKLKSAAYARKALVIVSDGADNRSRHSLGSVKRRAKEADAQIYAINVCDNPAILITKKLEERFGRRWLTQVSEITGGRTISVDNADAMPDAAARISRELRNQYVLGYRPADITQDGKWRKIRVRVTRPPNPLPFQVYYRTGYMARKDERQ